MLILARTRAKRPGAGYARTFVTQMEQVMGTCLDRGIKVVSNAGGLDPDHCAEAVADVAATLGLSPTIAYVNGDDLIPRLDDLLAAGVDLPDMATGEPLADPGRFVSANAYLGCWGIVDALERGADIVITGRTTDAAVVCGPAAWHHGWARDDWDALAGAVVAGHVIECGTQATGGNYSFFTEVPGLARPGFPWAEIAADGSTVIGKHDQTGGEVSIGTVTSQLLYEIGSPAYLGPDVTARFDTIGLEQAAPDRVRIHGTKGEPPPSTLKVSMNELGGFRSDLSVALTGLDVEAKAALVEEAFWTACPNDPDDFAAVESRVVPDRQGPRRTQGRAGHLQRHDRTGARQYSRILRSEEQRQRTSLRRPQGRSGSRRPGPAARGGPGRRPDGGRLRRSRSRSRHHPGRLAGNAGARWTHHRRPAGSNRRRPFRGQGRGCQPGGVRPQRRRLGMAG